MPTASVVRRVTLTVWCESPSLPTATDCGASRYFCVWTTSNVVWLKAVPTVTDWSTSRRGAARRGQGQADAGFATPEYLVIFQWRRQRMKKHESRPRRYSSPHAPGLSKDLHPTLQQQHVYPCKQGVPYFLLLRNFLFGISISFMVKMGTAARPR